MNLRDKVSGESEVNEMSEQRNIQRKTTGKAERLGTAATIMSELSKHLWMDGEKFRVTIECDPEENSFEIVRETLT